MVSRFDLISLSPQSQSRETLHFFAILIIISREGFLASVSYEDTLTADTFMSSANSF